MPEPDHFALAAGFALRHRVPNSAFRKFWLSLSELDRRVIAQGRVAKVVEIVGDGIS